MRINNQQGFSVVLVLAVVVVLGLVGAAGWYIYKSQNKNQQEVVADTAEQSENLEEDIDKVPEETQADEQKEPVVINGPNYKSVNNKYSLVLPNGWKLYGSPDNDNLIAFDANDIKPDKDAPGTVTILSGGRDGTVAFYLIYDYKSGENAYLSPDLKVTKTYTTNNGVKVTKSTRYQTKKPEGQDIPIGTREYSYMLTKDGENIRIVHQVLPGETDQSSNIEELIVSTKFL
jgi:hypothetical protein